MSGQCRRTPGYTPFANKVYELNEKINKYLPSIQGRKNETVLIYTFRRLSHKDSPLSPSSSSFLFTCFEDTGRELNRFLSHDGYTEVFTFHMEV